MRIAAEFILKHIPALMVVEAVLWFILISILTYIIAWIVREIRYAKEDKRDLLLAHQRIAELEQASMETSEHLEQS